MKSTTATSTTPNANGARKISLRIGQEMHTAIATCAGGDVSGWIREAIRQRLTREAGTSPAPLLETLRARLAPKVAQALRDLAELYERPQDAPAVRDTDILTALSDAIMAGAVGGGVISWRNLV